MLDDCRLFTPFQGVVNSGLISPTVPSLSFANGMWDTWIRFYGGAQGGGGAGFSSMYKEIGICRIE